MRKPKIEDVKVGMVFRVKHGKAINYARVTKRPQFKRPGDRPDIFYAVFVKPDNFSQKRLSDDREFSVWDYEYNGKREKWNRVR